MAYPMQLEGLWWVKAFAGVVSILFGISALLWPGLTLLALVVLFGLYALIDGILSLVAMYRAIRANAVWWPQLLMGLVGIATGIAVFAYPGITTVILLYIIAAWAIVLGTTEIIGAFVFGRWALALAGVISVMFGFVLLSNPAAGALALVLVIGVFAIVRGAMLLVSAVRTPALVQAPR